jgi:Kef-type K+ transport system membrane component KefB
MNTLNLIGMRGFIIAFFGCFIPTGIGIGLTLAIGTDMKGAIAAGAAFGPTSMGIALNIMSTGGILNT